jgi:hypothetical protein
VFMLLQVQPFIHIFHIFHPGCKPSYLPNFDQCYFHIESHQGGLYIIRQKSASCLTQFSPGEPIVHEAGQQLAVVFYKRSRAVCMVQPSVQHCCEDIQHSFGRSVGGLVDVLFWLEG